MAGFSGASEQVRLAFVLLLVTVGIHVLAFGSPFWSTRSRVAYKDSYGNVFIERSGGHAGLWTACTEGQCYERYNIWTPGFVRACQAFMTSSLVLLVSSTLLLALYIWQRDFDRDRRLVAIGFVATTLAGVLTLLTVFVWPAGQQLMEGEYHNWPYALATFSALFSAIIALLHVIEMRRVLVHQHEKLMPTTSI